MYNCFDGKNRVARAVLSLIGLYLLVELNVPKTNKCFSEHGLEVREKSNSYFVMFYLHTRRVAQVHKLVAVVCQFYLYRVGKKRKLLYCDRYFKG